MLFAVPVQGTAKSIFVQDSVSVSIVGSDAVRVAPGDVLTLALRVERFGSGSSVLRPHIDLPAAWRSLRPQGDITIEPGSPIVRLVSIHIPDQFLAGSYSVTFSVADPDRAEIASQATASVAVETVHGLSLEINEPPSFIAAGKALQAELVVFNDGNARADIELSWEGSQDGVLELERRQLLLEAGQSAPVAVSLVTDGDVAHVTTVSYSIRARIVDVPEVQQDVSIRTDIIPIYEKMASRGAPIPLSLTMEAVGDSRGTQPVARVESSFDALGGKVEVVGTLANKTSQGLFGARNALRVSYASEKVEIVVGDQAQNLSPLTVWGAYRIGASSRLHIDEWDIMVLGSRNRSYAPDDALTGLSVKRNLGSASSVSTNVLFRRGLYSGTAATLAYDWRPAGSRHSVAAECGLSGANSLSDPSCRLEAALAQGPVRSRIEALSAANSLPGTRSGTRSISESVRIRLLPGLYAEESFQVHQRAANTGSDRTSHASRVGLTYSRRFSGTTWTATMQGSRDVISLRSPSEKLHSESHTLRFSTSLQRRTFGFSTTREIGRRLDRNVVSSPIDRTRAQVRLSPVRWLNVSFSGDRYADFLISSRIQQQYSQYGIRAGLQLPSQVQLSIGGVHNKVSGRSDQTYKSLTFQASKQFASGSRAFVQSQSSVSDGRSNVRKVEFRMGVTMPLGIPNPSSRDISDTYVSGFVYHMVTGIPVEGVLIRFGQHMAITNARGEFRLPRTTGAPRYLEVNQTSLPKGSVPLVEMPYLIQTDVLTVDIPIVAAGAVEGHIVRLGSPGDPGLLYAGQDSDLIEKERVFGALVELRSDARSWRTRTDQSGSFTFRGVPGGAYTLRVLSADRLPAYHELRSDEFNVLVEGDSITTRRFEAIPIKRTIRFQDTGGASSLRLGSPSGRKKSEEPRESNGLETMREQTDVHQERSTPDEQVDSTSTSAAVPMLPEPPSLSPPTPTRSTLGPAHSPVMALLLVLSLLSYLLAADLMLRHVVRMRHRELGNIWSLHESRSLWHVRQAGLYGLVLAGVVASMGPLAGISAALGLCAISIVIESWSTVYYVISAMKLRLMLLDRKRLVVLYHGVIASRVEFGGSTVRLTLRTGQSIVMDPTSALGPAVNYLRGARATDFAIPIQRSANLVAVRADVTAYMRRNLHAEAMDSLHVSWEDISSDTTLVRVFAVTERAISDVQLKQQVSNLLTPYAKRQEAKIFRLPVRAA